MKGRRCLLLFCVLSSISVDGSIFLPSSWWACPALSDEISPPFFPTDTTARHVPFLSLLCFIPHRLVFRHYLLSLANPPCPL